MKEMYSNERSRVENIILKITSFRPKIKYGKKELLIWVQMFNLKQSNRSKQTVIPVGTSVSLKHNLMCVHTQSEQYD